MLLITIWWFVDAHKWFKGPKVNIEHHMQSYKHETSFVEGMVAYEGSSKYRSPSSAPGKDVVNVEVK